MVRRGILIFLLMIGLLIIGVTVVSLFFQDENEVELQGENLGKVEVAEGDSENLVDSSNNNRKLNEENKMNEEGTSGGSGGGSGGSGGGTEGSISENGNCEEVAVAFSLKNLLEKNICNIVEQGICIDKSVICSLDVYNLDNFGSALFRVQFAFHDKNKEVDEAFKYLIKEKELSGREIFNIEANVSLKSVGADGIANKEISCGFTTVSIPKKKIC